MGTEHLLLAALRQPEGLPAGVVERFGLAYEEAAATIETLLAEHVRLRDRLRLGR